MKRLIALIRPRRRLLAQEREIAALRAELARAQAQLESMKAGMRRCISCDYRMSVKARTP